VDEWADDGPEPGEDEEVAALTGDITAIVAGRTVVPAGIMWWRTPRERRAQQNAASSKPPKTRWFEI
jgi:hypothetical protein